MAEHPSLEVVPAPARGDPGGLSVLIVDDSRLYRDGLAALISQEADVAVVRTSSHWMELLEAVADRVPDVVLVNVAMRDGAQIVSDIHTGLPQMFVIAIGVDDIEPDIVRYAENGISGYLLRSEPLSALTTLIRNVVDGGTFCSPRITAALMHRVALLADELKERVPVLTAREDQILDLLDAGLSNQQIADSLQIELRTVKNHVHHILGKLGVARRGEAVAATRSLQRSRGLRRDIPSAPAVSLQTVPVPRRA